MISVIIPAYNEEKRIKKTVLAIFSVLKSKTEDFEILVVNDGSSDQTAEVVKELENSQIKLLSYEKNRGKGGAVTYGVAYALGESIVFIDADLPYPPEKILETDGILKAGADVVLGKRVLGGGEGKYPWYRKVMSKIFGLWVKLFLGLREKDTQCGFKGFTQKAAKEIFSQVTLSGWGFDVEVIFLAELKGFSIQRIPVELFHEREGSKINIKKTSVNMIRDVLAVRKNKKMGIYN